MTAGHVPDLSPTPAGAVSRRDFLRGTAGVGALSLFGGGLLSACGGDSSGGSAKEITFWNFYGPAPDKNPQSQWFVSLVGEWNKSNDVKVKLRYLPVADYLAGTALQTAFQSGEGPDIFLISPGDFLRYSNGGVLADLSSKLPGDATKDYVSGVLDTRKVDGKIYGLPMEIEPLALYYDVKAFEAAGLSEADVPSTWDQLLDVGDKLTTSKRFGMLFETIPGYYQNFTWYPFMWMGGGEMTTGGKASFDSPAAIAGLQFWQDTVKSGIAPRKPQGDGAGNASANIASGYCAMQQTGIWSVSDLSLNNKKFEYGVAPLPTPSGGEYTTDLGGWAFVANAKGKNPKAAVDFVTWALASTDKKGVERCRQWNTVVKTNIPPRKSVREAADARGAFGSPALKSFIDKVAPGGRPEPRVPPEVYKAVSDALQSAQLDATDPAEAAGKANQTIDTFLKSYDGASIL